MNIPEYHFQSDASLIVPLDVHSALMYTLLCYQQCQNALMATAASHSHITVILQM